MSKLMNNIDMIGFEINCDLFFIFARLNFVLINTYRVCIGRYLSY